MPFSQPTSLPITPSRSAALDQLSVFLPSAGRAYASGRNYDDGIAIGSARSSVSQLSPWLHAGLISEAEVIDKVLSRHSMKAAEKFISEVFWRIYFKGYLEQRPTIWGSYCEQRKAAFAQLESDETSKAIYTQAITAQTGIAAFDTWVRELTETGYLHNHARMWFASIWIFTLKLDWSLGADFFLRHLMDADAASNTLSWRWVGGLHTKGKTYLARPDNIARYTANRPGGSLQANGLAQDAPALHEATEHGRQPLNLPQMSPDSLSREPYALILHDEGASHIPLNLPSPPALVIGAARPDARSDQTIGTHARNFAVGAVETGLTEAAKTFDCPVRVWEPGADLSDLLASTGISHLAMPNLPIGWTRDALWPQIKPWIEAGNMTILIDDLSRLTWPHARAGFFGVKKKIESILNQNKPANLEFDFAS